MQNSWVVLVSTASFKYSPRRLSFHKVIKLLFSKPKKSSCTSSSCHTDGTAVLFNHNLSSCDVPVWLSLKNCQMINHLNTLSPVLGLIKKQHATVLWFVCTSLEICSFCCEVFFSDKLLVFENQYLPF